MFPTALIFWPHGSEYPAVIIPVLIQHYAMLQRNLLYTGVTRGKRLVVLVEEGRRHRGAQRLGPAAVVEISGMAASGSTHPTTDRLGGLTAGRLTAPLTCFADPTTRSWSMIPSPISKWHPQNSLSSPVVDLDQPTFPRMGRPSSVAVWETVVGAKWIIGLW